jgi:hypothetical protein
MVVNVKVLLVRCFGARRSPAEVRCARDMRVLTMTTSHKWYDTLTFWLESCNLRKLRVEVTVLSVNCDSDDPEGNGVRVMALGGNRGRLGKVILIP